MINKKMKRKYEVTIHNEYACDNIWELRDKYVKWFDTLKKAKKYASSIKNELKVYFKEKKIIDNTIVLDVNRYHYENDEKDELFDGIVYTLNIVGKY